MSEGVKGICRESGSSAALMVADGAASLADFADRAVVGLLQC